MTISKVSYADIVNQQTDGENAAALINDEKRAINETIDFVSDLPDSANFGTAAVVDTGTAQDQIELNSQKTFKSFDSLTSAIAFVAASPSTIERLYTASHRARAECTALGIAYPDGGGVDYVIEDNDGKGASDGVWAAGSKQLKISVQGGEINLEVFGTHGAVDASIPAADAVLFAGTNNLILVGSTPTVIENPVDGDGSQRFKQTGNYSISGAASIYNVSLIIDKASGTVERTWDRVDQGPFETLGEITRITNRSDGGYGARVNYHQTVDVGNFSIAQGIIAKTDGAGQSLGLWIVQATPDDNSKMFGVFCQEINPINAAGDQGYAKRRGTEARWMGGLQVVPEGKDLTRTGSLDTYNCLFGVVIAPSAADSSAGVRNKFYNGVMIEQNSIAEGGVGVSADGRSDSIDRPDAAFRSTGHWRHALDTRGGVFDSDRAVRIGNDQYIAFDNSTQTNTAKIFGVNSSDQVVFGAAKEDGEYQFLGFGPNKNAFTIKTDAAATSYLSVEPSSLDAPTLAANSSAIANVDIKLQPKGSGKISFGNYSAGVTAITGYIEIKDISGNVHKLGVIA